jgi:hypothetical protein
MNLIITTPASAAEPLKQMTMGVRWSPSATTRGDSEPIMCRNWKCLSSAIALLPASTSPSKAVSFELGTDFTTAGYNGTVITIPEGCTVRIITSGTTEVVLDADSQGSFFIVEGSLTLESLTLKNGFAGAGNGGVLSVDKDGLATFTGCSFINNTAPHGDGGVAHVHPNGSAIFTSCSFVGNAAGAGGGAVDVYEGFARFDNCSFEEDRRGGELKFNGVYNGGTVLFGCLNGTKGAEVLLHGNANTSQLPPAKQVVSCH